MIQIIEIQEDIYRLIIDGKRCDLIGLDLFTKGLFPLKRCYVNGSLGWYVNRKFISFNKIKRAIQNN